MYPKLFMICKSRSPVRYRELDTQGSGKTTNNDGNISCPEVLKNRVVRLSISYRPCGVGTKFNTRDNEIKSYFSHELTNLKSGTSSTNGRVMKSCSSIRGSLEFKSTRRINPPRDWVNLAIALSHSKHPTSNTLIPVSWSALSQGTRILEESPPCCGSCPLNEAC